MLLCMVFGQSSPIGTSKYPKIMEEIDGEDMDIDAKTIRHLLRDKLGLDVEFKIMTNLRKDDIFWELRNIEKTYEAYMFVFLTYISDRPERGLTKIQCFDKDLALEELFKLTSDKYQTKFHGKPKLFIVQADNMDLMYPDRVMKALGSRDTDDESLSVKWRVPSDVDRFVIISTIPQMLSNLSTWKSQHKNAIQWKANDDVTLKPSPLIRAMYDVISLNNTHLAKQVVWINRRLQTWREKLYAEHPVHEMKPPPLLVFTSSMMNLFYFKDYCRTIGSGSDSVI